MSLLQPFSDQIDRLHGTLAAPDNVVERRLSAMAAAYEDQDAVAALLREGDPLIYQVYEKKLPEVAGELQWCMSVTLPGRVGREYYMTKGHYHALRDTAEVYLCVRGCGFMLMQTEEGHCELAAMKPDVVVHVPGRWAHRSINTGKEPLISFCVYPAHAGHDYGTVETEGFLKRVVEIDGRPTVIDRTPAGAERG